MKVLASVKKICRNCKIVRRHGVVRVICTADARHKQRQGLAAISFQRATHHDKAAVLLTAEG